MCKIKSIILEKINTFLRNHNSHDDILKEMGLVYDEKTDTCARKGNKPYCEKSLMAKYGAYGFTNGQIEIRGGKAMMKKYGVSSVERYNGTLSIYRVY